MGDKLNLSIGIPHYNLSNLVQLGRKKKDKGGSMMVMMAMGMGGMMMKMMMGKVALIAMKALIIGKIALILSGIMALKVRIV